MIALATRTVQNMPDCLRREPITVFDPASMTADKQVSAAKLRVANALGISLKLICFDAKLFDDFWIVRVIGQIPEISSPHGTVKVYSFGGFLVSPFGDSRSYLPSGAAKDLLLPAAWLAPVDHRLW
jgi:hypothetical protein